MFLLGPPTGGLPSIGSNSRATVERCPPRTDAISPMHCSERLRSRVSQGLSSAARLEGLAAALQRDVDACRTNK